MRKNNERVSNICPFVASYSYKEGSGVVFLLPNKIIKFSNIDSKLLSEVCSQCNGFNTVSKIVRNISISTKYSEQEILYLIKKLIDNNILIDIHNYYRLFHFISSNPMPYIIRLGNNQLIDMFTKKSPFLLPVFNSKIGLEVVMNKRISNRNFIDKNLTEKDLLRLIWSMYGKIDRSKDHPQNNIGVGTVPSGGSLYPLRLRVIVFKRIGNYGKGIYQISNGKLKYMKKINDNKIEQSFFGSQPFMKNAAVCVAIASEFKQTTQKYSNRGYRYAFLEAGHVAQNAYLWCAENTLGIVEICGFNDVELANIIGLNYPEEAVLTTVFVGKI